MNMLDPVIEQKMDIIAEEIFGTENDPSQIPVTKESGDKLERLTPNWIEYELDEKGDPISWVIILPTTKELAEKFLDKEITERELLDLTKWQEKYSVIYLCAAITILEYRRKGLALKLFKQAIAKIPKIEDYMLFAWPIGEGVEGLNKKLENDLGKKILVRK